MIFIDTSNQSLHHRRSTGVCKHYRISTASKGNGNMRNSWQTPLGRHRIAEKIGQGMPLMTAFVGRVPVGYYAPHEQQAQRDWILTRIIRLAGEQSGVNRRGVHDTFQRMIYIHGTHDEASLGRQASHGCIRMANHDIVALFARCHLGEKVYIR